MNEIKKEIFRAYDVRGVYPEEFNEEVAYRIAQAYAKFISPKTVVVGMDVRHSGPTVKTSAIKGLNDHGVDVIDIGVVPTDMMYFAVVEGGYDGGLQISASHNPAQFNGIKLVRAKAHPVSGDTGIMDIRDIVLSGYEYKSEKPGGISKKDFQKEYIESVLSLVDVSAIKPMQVVANCNYGSIGPNLRVVSKRLGLELITINEEPDGSFPKGRPDPLIPENRQETIGLILKEKPDFGVAWDADADRVYFFDEKARFLSGYFTTAVLSKYMLDKYPGSKVVIDMKQNWAIIDTVKGMGGVSLPNRTGHSFFKERMLKEDAVFGGEVSGHYFFKDFHYLDNGMIPFLIILEMLSKQGEKLSQIYQSYFDKYFAIEETSVQVEDVEVILDKLKKIYKDGKLSEIDGVSIDYPDWRFNVRPSNTEPLLRLNLEARSEELMKRKSEEVLGVIEK